MSSHDIRSAARPDPDQPMVDIADYVTGYTIESKEACDTARYMLLDSLACAMLAMKFPECVKHLGPLVPGAVLAGGARVPGTSWELDPAQAAYNIGVQVRWLDFNDTWLAAEWGHPSDNLGAILAVADYLSRKAEREGGTALTVRDVLGYAIKAHEIQGCYALRNSFNRVGLDHVILVRLASTAVTTRRKPAREKVRASSSAACAQSSGRLCQISARADRLARVTIITSHGPWVPIRPISAGPPNWQPVKQAA